MNKEKEKMRKVDKKAFLDDFSKEFMLQNTFGHNKDKDEARAKNDN